MFRFSPNGSKFVTASDDGTLKLWSFNEGLEERSFTEHGWDVRCVDWHPVKGLFASGSKDNLVKLWDPRVSKSVATLRGHMNTIQSLRFQPAGNFLASVSRDQSGRVTDLRSMRTYKILRGHQKEFMCVTWHPVFPSLLSTGGGDGAINHYILDDSSAVLLRHETEEEFSQAETINPTFSIPHAHDLAIWSMQYHPLGHVLCTGSNDRATRFWARPRPDDPTFEKDRYYLGEDAEELAANPKASIIEALREEVEEANDEAAGLVDQQMPYQGDFPLPYQPPPMPSIPGLGGQTQSNFASGLPLPLPPPPPSQIPSGMDISSFLRSKGIDPSKLPIPPLPSAPPMPSMFPMPPMPPMPPPGVDQHTIPGFGNLPPGLFQQPQQKR